jgi:hypothetical protein
MRLNTHSSTEKWEMISLFVKGTTICMKHIRPKSFCGDHKLNLLQTSSERAVLRLNHTAQLKSGKRRSSSKKDELLLSQRQPGHESDPAAIEVIQSIEAAVQRLTSFVAELGTMGPVKVLDRVYAPREVREGLLLRRLPILNRIYAFSAGHESKKKV